MINIENVIKLLRHKKNVQSICEVLGLRFIYKGQEDLGREILSRGFSHDQSKIDDILEWDILVCLDEPIKHPEFQDAFNTHVYNNPHHPECYLWPNGIKDMHDAVLAELMADWKARSFETGGNFREYVEETAMSRYKFTKEDRCYQKIMEFYELSLDKF